MKNFIRSVRNYLLLDDKGQTLVEFVSILVLIAVVVVLMVTSIGRTTNNYYSSVNSSFGSR